MAKQKLETIVLIVILVGLFLMIKPFFENGITNVESVQIEQPIIDFLNDKFRDSSVEFAFCLKGEINNGIAKITELIEPETRELIGTDGIGGECPKGIIGTIHNHPGRICTMSLQDAYTFGLSKLPLSGIICGEDNINFYTPNSLKESLN